MRTPGQITRRTRRKAKRTRRRMTVFSASPLFPPRPPRDILPVLDSSRDQQNRPSPGIRERADLHPSQPQAGSEDVLAQVLVLDDVLQAVADAVGVDGDLLLRQVGKIEHDVL